MKPGNSIRVMTSDESLDRLTRAIRTVQDYLPNSTVSDEAAIQAAEALERAGTILEPFHASVTPSADWTVLGMARGGTIPLMFDEIFGRMSTSDGVLRRAASLKVDFRSVTPIGAELSVEGHLERTEGRKSWLVGTLHHGDTLTAEAESLWINVRPGGL